MHAVLQGFLSSLRTAFSLPQSYSVAFADAEISLLRPARGVAKR
jgi:hypothetical protein